MSLVPVSPQGQPADVRKARIRPGLLAHGGGWAHCSWLTWLARARAAQACLCSQMAVQLISLVNCPTTLTRNPRPCRRTIHAIPESQGCLVLLCLGWSTTLCGDGSRWKRLCMNLPCTATTVLLSAAPDMSPSRASRTAWNAVTATALAVRGNAGYSFTLTSNTQPHSTTASMQMHLP